MIEQLTINPKVRKALVKEGYKVKKIEFVDGYYIVHIDMTSMEYQNMPKGIEEKEWLTAYARYMEDAHGMVERVFLDEYPLAYNYQIPNIFIYGL